MRRGLRPILSLPPSLAGAAPKADPDSSRHTHTHDDTATRRRDATSTEEGPPYCVLLLVGGSLRRGRHGRLLSMTLRVRQPARPRFRRVLPQCATVGPCAPFPLAPSRLGAQDGTRSASRAAARAPRNLVLAPVPERPAALFGRCLGASA